MTDPVNDWMQVRNADEVPSPALLVYTDRVATNLDRMVEIAGDPARLRPHVKTHKTPQLVAMQVARGITRCKAATIAEAEMAAAAGATDVLLATQPVGPAVGRLLRLVREFPGVRFSALVDDGGVVAALATAAAAQATTVPLFVDLDVGQRRTGIAPGDEAVALCLSIAATEGVELAGLHAYDGHLGRDPAVDRSAAVDQIHAQLSHFRERLAAQGVPVPTLIVGGTPTFPLHAQRPDVECSPGTSVLWDAGYGAALPRHPFIAAATLLTRVISRPGAGRLCLDLGHKAVASEMPHPRVILPALPDAQPVVHSEEHLVLATPRADEFPVGSVLYGIPWHICPTVALHAAMHVVEGGEVVAEWPVLARQRRLTV